MIPGSLDKKKPETAAESLTLWNRAASRYADDQSSMSTFHRSIYMPCVEAMMGDVRDKKVLDIGCGTGGFTKKLASRGAKITGTDGSREMLRYALRDNAHPSITYMVMDLTYPFPFKTSSVDIIIANMVLMDLSDIEVCLYEISRILNHGGLFVFSITHPAFFCSEWEGDALGPRAYKKVRDYLHTLTEYLDFWGETIHYHRPLSSYFRVLEKNGLCVLSLDEPIPDISKKEIDPLVNSHLRVPTFLVIKAALWKERAIFRCPLE
jgi:ubiquinone/menaquinone biosynthesis C-methylase UbiE